MRESQRINFFKFKLKIALCVICWLGFGAAFAQKESVKANEKKEADFTPAKALELVKELDERQRSSGDYKATAFIKETEKNKAPKLFQTTIYRRDGLDKFVMVFNKPKEDSGKAYLKIDKNLWNFEPGTGKWERRTEREKIGGTNSRRSDFDESRLTDEYTAIPESMGSLGKFTTYIVKLAAKEGVDVSYPVLKLWIDKGDGNVLKREEYALSGKLMRTIFYPRWQKIFSDSKKSNVYVPEEIRVFDELEKGNSTIIALKDVDLKKLEDNIFTKAWVESKSR